MATFQSRQLLVDGGLAAGVLAVVLVLQETVGARLSPGFVALGATGCVLLEVLLHRRRKQVRRVWQQRSVRATAFVVGTALAVGTSVVLPDAGLSALVGGLGTYLLVVIAAGFRSAMA